METALPVSVRVSLKGRIAIPKSVRKRLGITRGAVVAADRDTPVLLTLSLYEARLTRKYFGLLKQLRLTQKLRHAAEALEPRLLPAEAEAEARQPAPESPEAPPPPTPATGQPNPQPPEREPKQPEHLSIPSTARAPSRDEHSCLSQPPKAACQETRHAAPRCAAGPAAFARSPSIFI